MCLWAAVARLQLVIQLHLVDHVAHGRGRAIRPSVLELLPVRVSYRELLGGERFVRLNFHGDFAYLLIKLAEFDSLRRGDYIDF